MHPLYATRTASGRPRGVRTPTYMTQNAEQRQVQQSPRPVLSGLGCSCVCSVDVPLYRAESVSAHHRLCHDAPMPSSYELPDSPRPAVCSDPPLVHSPRPLGLFRVGQNSPSSSGLPAMAPRQAASVRHLCYARVLLYAAVMVMLLSCSYALVIARPTRPFPSREKIRAGGTTLALGDSFAPRCDKLRHFGPHRAKTVPRPLKVPRSPVLSGLEASSHRSGTAIAYLQSGPGLFRETDERPR